MSGPALAVSLMALLQVFADVFSNLLAGLFYRYLWVYFLISLQGYLRFWVPPATTKLTPTSKVVCVLRVASAKRRLLYAISRLIYYNRGVAIAKTAGF